MQLFFILSVQFFSVMFGNGVLFCYFYSGKIVSPKWKNFRGIKVNLKDKIRLNNIIWREWHRQCRCSAFVLKGRMVLKCLPGRLCIFAFINVSVELL